MALPFKPASDDGAIEFLREVFGSIIDTIVPPAIGATQTSESAAMLAEAFRYFNSGVLLFGSMIVLYVTVFSVVNTANDGAALGKKWNTFYTPVRTLISASALIPGASGYALIQWGLLFIVCQSIGFGSAMWERVIDRSTSQTIVDRAVRSITDDPNFDTVTLNALRMRMCAYGVNKAISSTLGTPSSGTQTPESSPSSQALTLRVTTKNVLNRKWFSENTTVDEISIWYEAAGWPGSENICGRVTLSNTMAMVKQSGNDALSADIKSSLRTAIEQVRNRFIVSLFTDGSEAASKLTPLMTKMIAVAESNGLQVSSEDVRKAITLLRAELMKDTEAAITQGLQSDNANIVKNLAGKGWIYAGSYGRELARIRDAIRTATSSQSQYIVGDDSALDLRLSGDVLRAVRGTLSSYMTLTDLLIQKVMTASTASSTKPVMPSVKTSFSQSDFLLGGDGVKTIFSKYFTNLGDTIVTGMVFYMEADDDPVMRVKAVGDWMAIAAEAVIFAKTASIPVLTGIRDGLAASAVPMTSALTGVVSSVLSGVLETWNSLMPSVYTVLYGGYFLGVWLPTVPFYIFAIGVVGWMIYVVEMCAAGVLWAAAHTTPTREDNFIGSQTQGYLLVMSGFFRPALMVLGLVASQAVLGPIVHYVNEGFVASFRSIQSTSTTGLMSIAAYVLVYCVIMLAAYMLVFSLPQSLPDRILRWIGAGIQDIGEQNTAGRVESGASGQSRNAALAAASKQAAMSKARADKGKNRRDSGMKQGADEAAKANAPEGHGGQSSATDTAF